MSPYTYTYIGQDIFLLHLIQSNVEWTSKLRITSKVSTSDAAAILRVVAATTIWTAHCCYTVVVWLPVFENVAQRTKLLQF